jgi:hypothetical protein
MFQMYEDCLRRPLAVPPRFGDTVRSCVGGPLMVVVDADELPSDAPNTALVTVMYADDVNRLHTIMVPWSTLHSLSASEAQDEAMDCDNKRSLDEELHRSCIAKAEMSARIAAMSDALRVSSDPASFFATLRSAIVELISDSSKGIGATSVSEGITDDALDSSRVIIFRNARVTPEVSGTYGVEQSDDPPSTGTLIPAGFQYVSPGVVRSSDGTQLYDGVDAAPVPLPVGDPSTICLDQLDDGVDAAPVPLPVGDPSTICLDQQSPKRYGDAPNASVDDDATNAGPAFVPHTHF